MDASKFFAIVDTANGIMQWSGEAASKDDAWAKFLSDLGYDEDVPGVCEQSAYTVLQGFAAIAEADWAEYKDRNGY